MSTHPCPVVGCPQLQPCPTHAHSSSAHRSGWRDRDKQKWFRSALLLRWDGHCQRCGRSCHESDVQAHHDRPGWDPEHGRLLCSDCHRALEPAHAR